ncbi:MAG: GTP-binding protein [Candidatus Aenigmarchaeota archaeon]|nr:GTP-binding protein [Candidatus Aenigmarchaeota archaeon]
MKISTGIEKLDEVLGGGVESNSAILLLTGTLIDKSSFSQHILSTRISEGDRGVYLTTSKPPTVILKNMYEHGWLSENIVFVDCISFTLKQESDAKYVLRTFVTKPEEAWEETLKLFEQALRETPGLKTAVFDCLEVFMGVGAGRVAEGIKRLKDIFDETKTTCFFLFTNWGYSEEELNEVCSIMDTVIKLDTLEKKLLWMNYFQYDDSPKILFQITQTGVNIYVPKILVTGPFGAGKSSTIHSLSEKAVSIDKLGTTIALDHGYIEKKGLVCDIFGTPGQERFDWILKILARDVWGVILVVDSTKPETFERAKEMLEKVRGYEIPFVVFANKQDLPEALSVEEIKKVLGFEDVVGTCAIKKEGLEEGLRLLFDKIFKLKTI